MDRLCACCERGFQDRLAVEIRFGQTDGLVRVGYERGVGICIDVDGDAVDSHFVRASNHAARDLSSIGD